MTATVSKYVRTGVLGVIAYAIVSTVCPLHAFAEETSGINAILPQMNEFIPMLIAFILLWIILAKFGWPVFDRMLAKRENMIKNSLEKSEEARQESERLLAEYREQLEGAKAQAQQILNNAKLSGDSIEAEITQRAREEADAMISKARIAIEAEKKAAIAELRASAVDTSIAVAERLIGEDFSDEEHRKLIARYVEEAGSLNA